MDEEQNNVVDTNSNNVSNSIPTERKGFNVTSLILGIISVVTFYCWYAAVPSGIMAIIFSVAGKKDAGRGMGTAGMVLGIIGLVLCILIYALLVLGIAAYFSSVASSIA